MPFDYESFIQGIITGLKLGRSPTGRTPPAPNNDHMINEIEEDRMIIGQIADLPGPDPVEVEE